MRYQIEDADGRVVCAEDDLAMVAEHCGISAKSLYTQLSAAKGVLRRGRGKAELTVRDFGRADREDAGARGPAKTNWHYICQYQDSEFPDQHWGIQHEIDLDEIYTLTTFAYQKLAQATLDARLASTDGLKLMIPVLGQYRFNSVVIIRVKPERFRAVYDAWSAGEQKQFDDEHEAFRARLKKFRPRRK